MAYFSIPSQCFSSHLVSWHVVYACGTNVVHLSVCAYVYGHAHMCVSVFLMRGWGESLSTAHVNAEQR